MKYANMLLCHGLLKMNTAFLRLSIGIAALAISLEANANITVALEPSSQTISVGNPVSVDLVISGLGNFASPSLGGFDFDLSYNPAVLGAVSVTFGSHLDLGIVGSLQNSGLSTAGAIHVDETSFESSTDLHTNQPSTFTLATLNFSSVGLGISTIDFTSGSLSDDTGQISLEFLTQAAQVQVNGNSQVPDSCSTAWLLGVGLVGLVASRRTLLQCSASDSEATN